MKRIVMIVAAVTLFAGAGMAAPAPDKPPVPPPPTVAPQPPVPDSSRPPGTTGEATRPINPAERDRIVVPPPADPTLNTNPR